MPKILEFDILHEYSIYKTGTTVEAILRISDLFVDVKTKIETGSSYCIFEQI